MNPITILVANAALLAVASAIASLSYRRRDSRGPILVAAAFCTAIILYAVWDHNRRVGTPWAYDEPLWFTCVAEIIPTMVSIITVRRVAESGRAFSVQMVAGVLSGLASLIIAVFILYVLWVTFS